MRLQRWTRGISRSSRNFTACSILGRLKLKRSSAKSWLTASKRMLFFTELVSGLFGQSQQLRRGLPDDKHSAVVWACHRAAHAAFKRLCGGWSDYSLKYSAMLLDICDSGIQASDLVESIQWSCNKADTINVDTSLGSQDSETAVEM